uniref:LLGL domain-containing protein n=1 Tax=Parastrongyloides trichosuri TaxID=131310 RepID=A0A0N5A3T9_PARTI
MANFFARKKVFGKDTPPDFLSKNFQVGEQEILGFNDNIIVFHPGKYASEILYGTGSNALGLMSSSDSTNTILFSSTIYKVFYIDNIERKMIVVITGSGKKDFSNLYIIDKEKLFTHNIMATSNKNNLESTTITGNENFIIYKRNDIYKISCCKLIYKKNSFIFYYGHGEGILTQIFNDSSMSWSTDINKNNKYIVNTDSNVTLYFGEMNLSKINYIYENNEVEKINNFQITNVFANINLKNELDNDIYIIIGHMYLVKTIFGTEKLKLHCSKFDCQIVGICYNKNDDAVTIATSDGSVYIFDDNNLNMKCQIQKNKYKELKSGYSDTNLKGIKDFFFINDKEKNTKFNQPYIVFDNIKMAKIQDSSKGLTIFNKNGIGKKYVISSEIYDYHITRKNDDGNTFDEYDDILLILCRNEFIFIDLTDEPYYREIHPGFLLTLDHHTVSKTIFVDNISNDILKNLYKIEEKYSKNEKYSRTFNNIQMINNDSRKCNNNLLIIGYANGEVYFFNLLRKNMKYLFKIDTKYIFDEELEKHFDYKAVLDSLFLPNFCYAGVFDDYLDSENLAITSVDFSRTTGEVFIGNHGGYVLRYNLPRKDEKSIDSKESLQVNLSKSLIQLPKGAVCNINEALSINYKFKQSDDEYQLDIGNCIKCDGSKITTLFYENNEYVLAIGTEYSLHIYSFKKRKIIFETSTYTQAELAHISNAPLNRFKSLKKSLRQTFRRKQKIDSDGNKVFENENLRTVERQIEARAIAKANECMLGKDPYVVKILIVKESFHNDCVLNLYFGLYKGEIHSYILSDIINNCNRKIFPSDTLIYKHDAPIVDMKELKIPGDLTSSRLLVSNEERIFTLPLVCSRVRKDNYKWKITKHTGCRIKSLNFYNIFSNDLFISASLSNGEICGIVLSDKKKYTLKKFSDERNKNAIATSMLLPTGEIIHYNKRGSLLIRKTFLQL